MRTFMFSYSPLLSVKFAAQVSKHEIWSLCNTPYIRISGESDASASRGAFTCVLTRKVTMTQQQQNLNPTRLNARHSHS